MPHAILIAMNLLANPLGPTAKGTLSRKNRTPLNAASPDAWFITEDQRLVRHFVAALESVRKTQAKHGSRAQALLRSLLLEEVEHYARAGSFPRNHVAADETPVFVDSQGTLCAVAHMMRATGAEQLLARVKEQANLKRVSSFLSIAGVREWLEACGISAEEAAAIQPGYQTVPAACICNQPADPWNPLSPRLSSARTVVLELRGLGGDKAEVLAAHAMHDQGAPDFKVGDVVRVSRQLGALGQRSLGSYPGEASSSETAKIPSDKESLPTIDFAIVESDGGYDCGSRTKPVTSSVAVRAAKAPYTDCIEVLAGQGSSWESYGDPSTGCGCASHRKARRCCFLVV
jgi:hypothetical protein